VHKIICWLIYIPDVCCDTDVCSDTDVCVYDGPVLYERLGNFTHIIKVVKDMCDQRYLIFWWSLCAGDVFSPRHCLNNY
jgi:hypothetical protein